MAEEREIRIAIEINVEVQAEESAQAEIQSVEDPQAEIQPVENPEEQIPSALKMELYKAAVEGEVEKAESLVGNDECGSYRLMLRSPLTERRQTALHIAAEAQQIHFVEWMLQYVEQEDLELKDSNGNNAFCFAAIVGAKQIAEKMLEKNPRLLTIQGGMGMTPLYLAVSFGQSDMADYLYEKYQQSEEVENIEAIFLSSIRSNLYDLAMKLLSRDKELATVFCDGYGTALHMLAKNPSAFTSRGEKKLINAETDSVKLLKCIWTNLKAVENKNIGKYMDESEEIIFNAAKLGNFKFLEVSIQIYPDLVRKLDKDGRTMFHVALLHRHAAIFNLINKLDNFDKHVVTTLTDVYGNNLLHVAAKYLNIPRPSSNVPGAALQMQQELKIFKEVESLVMPSYREMRNLEDLTPREVFTKEHKDLLKNGEEWMKKTASSCMVTVIAILLFAFGLPVDYSYDEMPNHMEKALFYIFSLADTVALSSSLISMLMFLFILASRYKEEDFLKSLPLHLVVGLLTFFISLTTMMISFSSNFFFAYEKQKAHKMIPSFIGIIVFGPVFLFLVLQRRLLVEIFSSTFSSRRFKG